MARYFSQIIGFIVFLIVSWWFFGLGVFLAFLAVSAMAIAVYWRKSLANVWLGGRPHPVPLIYVEPRMAVRPSILSHTVPEGYRLACLFFGAGLIDRTHTLDHGFAYTVLDALPALDAARQADVHALCDERARQLVERAAREGRSVRLLWSGGIDSTAACVALLRAVQHDPARLEIIYSRSSRGEYRWFFRQTVRRHVSSRKITRLSQALDEHALITSGEHGDQIFGSIKALGLPLGELARPWEQSLPSLLRAQLASSGRADAVLAYLAPQLAKCPVRLANLFDLLWWLNFSMKWQAVSLRMLGSLDEAGFRRVEPHVDHFFRTDGFQRWALQNGDNRLPADWAAYKEPLKAYIRDATGDEDYYRTKQKEPSLRTMPGAGRGRLALAVDEDRRYLLQPFDEALRRTSSADDGGSVTLGRETRKQRGAARTSSNDRNSPNRPDFEPAREDPLWDDMSSGE